MSPTDERTRRTLTASEYLDQEERRAHDELKAALLAAGEDVCQLTDVRGFVRRHPVLALGASAALGAALAPLLPGLLSGAFTFAHRHKGRSGEALGALVGRFAKPL